MKNRILFFRILGTAAALPSIANCALFTILTVSTTHHGGPYAAISTISTIASILSTIHLLVFTASPTITSSSRLRLLSIVPTFIFSPLCAATLIWMTLSRDSLPAKINNTPIVAILLIAFAFLLISIILQSIFWAIIFFRPPQSRTPHIKGLPYTHTSSAARSHHNIRPYLPDIKIPPPTLDRHRSVVITVCDPAKGGIISQSVHTPKFAPPKPSFRASALSEQFRFSMPSVQNSIVLPSPRRESTPIHAVSKSVSSSTVRKSCEAEVVDISGLMTPRSLGLASVLPPTPAPLNTQTGMLSPDYSHFDAWEPSSPSTAEIQRGVEAETKAAEAEERLLRSVGMGMAAKGKKRPENLKLNQARVIDGRPCSPPLPKTPKTPGRRGSEQRIGMPVPRKGSMGGMGPAR